MRRRAWTRRLIVKGARGVPTVPRVEPTRRQPEELEEAPQREACAGLIDGAQDPQLVGTVRESFTCQCEAGDAKQDQRQPEQRREFLDALSEFQHFLSKFRLAQVRHVQTDHHGRRGAKPSPRRRPRHAEISSDRQIPSVLDELAQPVVGSVAVSGRGSAYSVDHRPFRHRAQLKVEGDGRSA
jgi:hypothetical protein